MIGQRINNYEIVAQIGEGGMGAVYMARHPFIDRKVAIKVLRASLANDPDVVQRFFNEAKAANAIRHPNIIDILDVGLLPDGRTPYLMMELLEGENVAQRLRRLGTLPVADAVSIALQTASAVTAAHNQGIVHRDLKPENLFLVRDQRTGQEEVKVLDFGIAKLRGTLSGNAVRTQTGALMGTPPYMSPEQCRGISADVDHRTDVYALGIIVYEMLCGTPPFVGEGFGDVLVQHLTQPPEPPRKRNQGIPASLERVILRALAKTTAQRYDTMADLQAALEGKPVADVPGVTEVLTTSAALGMAATPSTPFQRQTTTLSANAGEIEPAPDEPAPRSRGRLIFASAGATAVAALAVIFSLRSPSAPSASHGASTPAAVNTAAAVTVVPPPRPAQPDAGVATAAVTTPEVPATTTKKAKPAVRPRPAAVTMDPAPPPARPAATTPKPKPQHAPESSGMGKW